MIDMYIYIYIYIYIYRYDDMMYDIYTYIHRSPTRGQANRLARFEKWPHILLASTEESGRRMHGLSFALENNLLSAVEPPPSGILALRFSTSAGFITVLSA